MENTVVEKSEPEMMPAVTGVHKEQIDTTSVYESNVRCAEATAAALEEMFTEANRTYSIVERMDLNVTFVNPVTQDRFGRRFAIDLKSADVGNLPEPKEEELPPPPSMNGLKELLRPLISSIVDDVIKNK